MEHDPRAFLWDARQAADAIKPFTRGLDAETLAALLAELGPPAA